MMNYQKFPQKCDFHKKNMKYWFSEDKWYIFKGKNIGKKCKFIKSSPKNAISIKKTRNIDFRGINDNFPRVEKMEKLGVFKTFFLILKLDINKCPKWILKKKFAKMKIVFFSTFFWDTFSNFSYVKWSADVWQKCRWEHKKKLEKIRFFRDFLGFFGIFLKFFYFFGTDWTTFGQLWTTFG